MSGAKLYVVPKSKNAATLNNIENYDLENMRFWQCIRISFCCTSRNRLYLVPRESVNGDPPPSYRSVIASESARCSGRGRQPTPTRQRSSTALPTTQPLNASHTHVATSSSSRPQQTSEAQANTFETIENDLKELARLCAYRASIVKIFFAHAVTQGGPPPVPTLSADLNRLARSLYELRPSLRSAANRIRGSTRDQILEDGERVVAGLSRWMDKRKPTFDELRVAMFGNTEGYTLQVAAGEYEEWVRTARNMEKWCLIMTKRVVALREILENSLLPPKNLSTGMLPPVIPTYTGATNISTPRNHTPRAEDMLVGSERQRCRTAATDCNLSANRSTHSTSQPGSSFQLVARRFKLGDTSS
jgi:hypothetical protein